MLRFYSENMSKKLLTRASDYSTGLAGEGDRNIDKPTNNSMDAIPRRIFSAYESFVNGLCKIHQYMHGEETTLSTLYRCIPMHCIPRVQSACAAHPKRGGSTIKHTSPALLLLLRDKHWSTPSSSSPSASPSSS